MKDYLTQLPARLISPTQWLMAITVVVVASFMLLASRAEARVVSQPYQGPVSHGQTLSHCGFLNTRKRLYGKVDPRNTTIIQSKLETLGYDVGATGVDGRYGPRTRHAVRAFQADYGLQRDGVVGIETSKTLAFMSHPHRNVRRCPYPAQPMRN